MINNFLIYRTPLKIIDAFAKEGALRIGLPLCNDILGSMLLSTVSLMSSVDLTS